MPIIYKRNCDNCGVYYEGSGKKYCSTKCTKEAQAPEKSLRYSIDSPILRMEIIKMLKGDGAHFSDLATRIGVKEAVLKNVVSSLQDSGYVIEKHGNFIKITSGIPEHRPFKISPSRAWGKERVFGVVSDSHLGSYQERLDVLEFAYDDFKRRGIKTVYHAGNIVEGECHFNKYDIRVHGITDQTLYCLDHYPQRDGITTFYITADDHEGWWFQREGIDFGRYLQLEAQERGRKDLIHLGYQEVDIELKEKNGFSVMRLVHPGGGSAYAISYALQKLVESFQGGEKPNILLCGHYHKAGVFYPREVNCVLCGCTCDQSRFMRKKKIQAHVGYYILKILQNKDGTITEFTTTFIPFFDRKFYISREE